MAWTAEDRRKYAPAIQEVVRQGMLVRLVRTMDALDPQPKVGRERVWSTLIVLQALWHLARDGCAWRRLPAGFPPFTTVWSRLRRWRELAVLDRGFAGEEPEAFLDRHGIAVEVVGIKDRRGFQLEKRRWKAEQTFGCLQRYRRLRVDDEMSCETSRGMAMLAALFMTGMRLERLVAS